MTREEAWTLLTEYTPSKSLRKHSLAVEAAMRHYARHFSEPEELWGLVGVLHDGSVIPMTSVMGLTTSLSLAVFLMLLWRRPGEDVGTVATEARSDV